MKRLSNKKFEAVDSLRCDIDELSNKPRRLFSALREFAVAFLDDKEHREEVIKKIDEFESLYYSYMRMSDFAGEVVEFSREVKCDYRNKESEYDVHRAINELTKKVLTSISELN